MQPPEVLSLQNRCPNCKIFVADAWSDHSGALHCWAQIAHDTRCALCRYLARVEMRLHLAAEDVEASIESEGRRALGRIPIAMSEVAHVQVCGCHEDSVHLQSREAIRCHACLNVGLCYLSCGGALCLAKALEQVLRQLKNSQ